MPDAGNCALSFDMRYRVNLLLAQGKHLHLYVHMKTKELRINASVNAWAAN